MGDSASTQRDLWVMPQIFFLHTKTTKICKYKNYEPFFVVFVAFGIHFFLNFKAFYQVYNFSNIYIKKIVKLHANQKPQK